MERIFLQFLNMSVTGSIVILVVLAARLFLKKAPKMFSYALWPVVLFRLVCPFSFESVVSLFPTKAVTFPLDIGLMQSPVIDTGVAVIDSSVNSILPGATPAASVNPMQVWLFVGSTLWLLGIAVLLAHSFFALIRLKRRMKTAFRFKENVILSDKIDTAFVLGVLRPKIYLPVSLTDRQREYILFHEQTHIKRLDHLVKLVSFFVLCLHWFNPLVWVAFFASGKDMEMSCDETVVKKLGSDIKKEYSTSLLTLATGRRLVGGIPLAFGEGDTKDRIQNVLSYKKPASWVVLTAALGVMLVVVGFAANPDSTGNSKAVAPVTQPDVSYFFERHGKDGEVIGVAALTDQDLAKAIIMDVLVKSAAWEGVDVATLEEYYLIRQTFPETGETHDYYAYRLPDDSGVLPSGTAVLQSGPNGWYSALSDELYNNLDGIYARAVERLPAD